MLESFSFTEGKRKEVRDNIKERVWLLKDEDVDFSRILSSFGHVRTTIGNTYENILKGASLSDAICT